MKGTLLYCRVFVNVVNYHLLLGVNCGLASVNFIEFVYYSNFALESLGVPGTMSSLSRELVFLILQFLDEEKFKETVHK